MSELQELRELVDRLGSLLTGVANALKGEPGELRMHDWSDLPTLATYMAAVVEAAEAWAATRLSRTGAGERESLLFHLDRLREYREERAR